MKNEGSKAATRIRLAGRDWVIVPREDFERLEKLARVSDLPPLPKPDADRTFPAVDYARASIARSIVRARAQAGWSQRHLAKMAGVRVETLCRIEKGRTTPSTATISRLARVLRRAGAEGAAKPLRRRKAAG
jgi:ribosome-binding protein aMBF1 (putative translation factor)